MLIAEDMQSANDKNDEMKANMIAYGKEQILA